MIRCSPSLRRSMFEVSLSFCMSGLVKIRLIRKITTTRPLVTRFNANTTAQRDTRQPSSSRFSSSFSTTSSTARDQHDMPSVVWDLIEPGLQKFKLYTPPDPTYGRYLTKPWAPEQALDNDPTIRTRRRRVFLHGRAAPDSVDIEFAEDITLVPEELSKARIRGGRWVYYKSWEMKEESLSSKEGLGVDILLVHGECSPCLSYVSDCKIS
jgi:hypothetical protein